MTNRHVCIRWTVCAVLLCGSASALATQQQYSEGASVPSASALSAETRGLTAGGYDSAWYAKSSAALRQGKLPAMPRLSQEQKRRLMRPR